MRDLPHHMKKLNRKVIRSEKLEAKQEELYVTPAAIRPKSTEKRLYKQAMRTAKEAHVPEPLSVEERNHRMKFRVPIWDKDSHQHPKVQKPTRKKTPRI